MLRRWAKKLVTRPYLLHFEDFKKGSEEILANQWLINNGPMLQKFQKERSMYLDVSRGD